MRTTATSSGIGLRHLRQETTVATVALEMRDALEMPDALEMRDAFETLEV